MPDPAFTDSVHGPALVAVAHGSKDPRAAAAIADLMALVPARAAQHGLRAPQARVAYLGHAAPSLPQVLQSFEPGTPVTVLPLLLTAAYHSKVDLPRELARCAPACAVTYGDTLGPHPLLLRALERRLPRWARQDPAGVAVVLASAGSSDPEANAAIAGLAEQWQDTAGWQAVRPAYASAAGPDPATAVARLLRDGARRVVVASYLLAPGVFADRILQTSLAAGAAAVSPALGAAPEVADVILDRFQAAGTRTRAAA